jgi:hypothetical protein
MSLEMTMENSPSRVEPPYPSLRGRRILVPIPAKCDGEDFPPSLSPSGDFLPAGILVPSYACVGVSTPGGSLDRRVNCRRVSQPRWVGARRSTKGGKRETGKRGNPRPSCCPAPRSGALAVEGYKRPRGRGRETLRVVPSSRAANLLVREPWTFLL